MRHIDECTSEKCSLSSAGGIGSVVGAVEETIRGDGRRHDRRRRNRSRRSLVHDSSVRTTYCTTLVVIPLFIFAVVVIVVVRSATAIRTRWMIHSLSLVRIPILRESERALQIRPTIRSFFIF
jgi:hypothetical protein